MTYDQPRSRRHLLRAAVGGAAAIGAAAIAAPGAALAADGAPVLLGQDNTSAGMTTLTRIPPLGPNDATFMATSVVSAGVVGHSTSGPGMVGRSVSSAGVQGYSETDAGVNGFGPLGVWASGDQVGVTGNSTDGTGILAWSSSGTALQVDGKAKFARAGKVSVPAGKSYADISVSGGLTSKSVVLATLQTHRAGVAVAAVRVNYPSAGKARIYLTKVGSTSSGSLVGWFVAEY